ncbi:MAG: hypothetical protein QG674_295 [Patescibacteria group bacterium]|jgi:translation elongation factor P/translation initiation factor 5A|nr:hypothetical protein [Patescibacteria group bacterium]
MVKINMLRPGNFILRNNEIFKLTSVYDLVGVLKSEKDPNVNYEHIRLTPEIYKLFTNEGDSVRISAKYTGGDYEISYSLDEKYYFSDKGNINDRKFPVETVDHLQNLYYYHTGEELKAQKGCYFDTTVIM